MTFEQWIQNPAGGKTAVMTNRQMYRDLYTAKFNKVMLREGNKFDYACYKNKKGTHYLIHIKVPSEVVPDFYYDVVISFEASRAEVTMDNHLNRYDIQVYTNSPDFVFTHCHAYVNADLFYRPLSNRMSKLSMTKVAVERNPRDEIGYVKSIYFAYLIMKSRQLFSKQNYNTILSIKDLANQIKHADDVVVARQEAEAKLKADLRREKKAEREKQKQLDKSNQHLTNASSQSKFVKKTPTIGSKSNMYTKKTRTTKRI